MKNTNLTEAFTREACDFIHRHQTQSFFLYLAYNTVHSPMQGADEYMKKFSHIEDIQRRIFAAMLAQLDDSVGKLTKQLRSSGVEENTLIVFLSDNGGDEGAHFEQYSAAWEAKVNFGKAASACRSSFLGKVRCRLDE